MLTGELRNQIDSIWNDFWAGGIANPLQVIEQITYLIFIKRLDEMQELEERKAATLGKPVERRIFPEGKDERGEPFANLRWSRFKHFAVRRCSVSSTSTSSRSSEHSMGRAHPTCAICAMPVSKSRGQHCSRRSSTRSTGSIWAIATLKATCMSTPGEKIIWESGPLKIYQSSARP